MSANRITFTASANHLSPNNFFATFYEINFATILKLYVGLGIDKIPTTVIYLNYNGNTVHVFESYLNEIWKMVMY